MKTVNQFIISKSIRTKYYKRVRIQFELKLILHLLLFLNEYVILFFKSIFGKIQMFFIKKNYVSNNNWTIKILIVNK